MAVTRFSCPHCHVSLKSAQLVPEGKRVKCPQCGDSFSVSAEKSGPSPVSEHVPGAAPSAVLPAPPLADTGNATWTDLESPNLAPAAMGPEFSKRAGKGGKLWIVAATIGVLGMAVLGGVLILVRFSKVEVGEFLPVGDLGGSNPHWPKSLDDPLIASEARLSKIRIGMTLDELQQVVGKGRRVQFEELPLSEQKTSSKLYRPDLQKGADRYRISTWYLWTGNDRWVVAGFRTNRCDIVGYYVAFPGSRSETIVAESGELPD